MTTSFQGGYTISPAAGSSCSGGTSANGVAAALPDPGPLPPEPEAFGSLPAYEMGHDSHNDEVVVFGRDEGLYDFTVAVNQIDPVNRRVTFINLDLMTSEGQVDYVMGRSRTNGNSVWAIYPGDDTTPIPRSGGGEWSSVGAYLATVVGSDSFHQLSASGSNLTALLTTFG